jgi:hypothetical protein
MKKIGIIICDRYHTCAGGKCLRALRNREGAFALYKNQDIEMVGYPPCPHLDAFCNFIPAKYGLDVVIGTHPIPQNYYITHQGIGTWQPDIWQDALKHVLTDEKIRLAYD